MGRKTGQPRTTALVYARDGDHDAGADRWQHRPAHARVAEAEERERLWELVNEKNRGLAPLFHRGVVGRYDLYQRHTRREIPVVIVVGENAGRGEQAAKLEGAPR
jgi:hypothetical protein